MVSDFFRGRGGGKIDLSTVLDGRSRNVHRTFLPLRKGRLGLVAFTPSPNLGIQSRRDGKPVPYRIGGVSDKG
jgi:hypothetical protein